MSLQGKTAVITGSNSGIGLGVARELARAGADVVLNSFTDRPEDHQLATDLGAEFGVTVRYIPADLSNGGQARALIEPAGRCDILVNNAGITRDAPLKRMQPQQWQEVLRTNLDSMYNMCQPVFDAMCSRGFGRIVNISSLNGGQGPFGEVNYSAAKAGIYGFTKAIAKEGAGKGVTVNAVSPGFIDTPMVRQIPDNVLQTIIAGVPVGRLGQPAEISRAVAFLTADDAGYITGTNISVNGGVHMS